MSCQSACQLEGASGKLITQPETPGTPRLTSTITLVAPGGTLLTAPIWVTRSLGRRPKSKPAGTRPVAVVTGRTLQRLGIELQQHRTQLARRLMQRPDRLLVLAHQCFHRSPAITDHRQLSALVTVRAKYVGEERSTAGIGLLARLAVAFSVSGPVKSQGLLPAAANSPGSPPTLPLRKVRYPQRIGPGRVEPALHQVRQPRRGRIRSRGLPPFAAANPLQAKVSHQPHDRASSHINAFPVQRQPHLASPVDAVVGRVHPVDLDLQLLIAQGTFRARARLGVVVAASWTVTCTRQALVTARRTVLTTRQ